ncbi:MAG: hypothetical protein ABL903_20570 [Methylococcales bacterium]
MNEGRVVFYSNKVHKGQLLNFDNMPIYGPIEYKGAPFAFRISIFELDVTSERTKALLNTLASAGGKAYPPSAPVLNLLNNIGKSFLDGEQNDTEFRYAMILDPKGGVEEIQHLTLETGNYVLIRVEDRDTEIPWKELVLNENTGQLLKGGTPYTDNTYVIVEINKNVSDVNIELAENNYSSLLKILQDEDIQKAKSWKNTRDALQSIAIQRSQIIKFSRAKEILGNLKSETNLYERRVLAKELMIMIANSVDSDGNTLPINPKSDYQPSLSNEQIEYILKNLRKMITLSKDQDLEKLEVNKIAVAFKKVGDKDTTAILDLIAKHIKK